MKHILVLVAIPLASLILLVRRRRRRLPPLIAFNPVRKATGAGRAPPTPDFNVDRATSEVRKNLLRIER